MVPDVTRRSFLGSGGASVFAVLAGCIGETTSPEAPTESPVDTPRSATPTEPEPNNSNTTVTSNPTDPIEVEYVNETDAEQLVQYSITRDSTTVSEGELTVPSGDVSSVHSDIKRMGEYELHVSVETLDEVTYPFDIEEYDLRMGSNLVVWMYEDKIETGIEE